ncbi:MAG: hypothetical protein WBA93_29690 [Microcoleaceae cyanobacterium]
MQAARGSAPRDHKWRSVASEREAINKSITDVASEVLQTLTEYNTKE